MPPEILTARAVAQEIALLKRKVARLEAKTVAHPEWDAPCLGCGQPIGAGIRGKRFCTAGCFTATIRRYASNADARRAGKDRRRARKRNAYIADVNRREVFERDGWTCRLCGLPVDRAASVPNPNAPTLDHILALANGGTHEPANAQLAHFMCNATKGDREWVA